MMHFMPYVCKGYKKQWNDLSQQIRLCGVISMRGQLLHLVGAGAGMDPPGSGPLKTVQY